MNIGHAWVAWDATAGKITVTTIKTGQVYWITKSTGPVLSLMLPDQMRTTILLRFS
jgi:hypothetical protein